MDPTRLTRIDLFSGLESRELSFVAKWATELSVPAGADIMREQDYAYDLLAIVEGTAEVRHGDTVVAKLGPGDTVGEIGLLSRGLRSATVTATSPLMLIRLTSWELRRLEKHAPRALDALRGLAAERARLAA
jgi:CRP-like cAMP-binding protein